MKATDLDFPAVDFLAEAEAELAHLDEYASIVPPLPKKSVPAARLDADNAALWFGALCAASACAYLVKEVMHSGLFSDVLSASVGGAMVGLAGGSVAWMLGWAVFKIGAIIINHTRECT